MSEHVSTSRWDMTEHEVRRNLIREMNRLGIVRIEASYSGGHGDGGLDGSPDYYDKNGQPVMPTIPEGKQPWELPIYQAVTDLLGQKFYLWSDDCSVEGKLYVDLREKRAWTEGEMEVTQWVEDTDPLNMEWGDV